MKCDSPINTNICELLDRPNPLHRQKIQCKWIKFIFHLKILNKIHKAVNTEKYSHSNPNNNMPGDNPEVYSTHKSIITKFERFARKLTTLEFIIL